MHPTSRRAVKSPMAIARAGNEERPALAVRQLDAVREAAEQTQFPLPRVALGAHVDAASVDRVLGVCPAQQDRQVRPWVVMKRSVVVAAHEAVQIDVEESIARDNPPAEQVGVEYAADDDVGRAARD